MSARSWLQIKFARTRLSALLSSCLLESALVAPRAAIKDLDNLKYAMALFVAHYNMTA